MLKKIFLISLIVYAVNTSDCTTATPTLKEDCYGKTAADGQYCCLATFSDDNNTETSKKCVESPKTQLDITDTDPTIFRDTAFLLALQKMNQGDWPEKGKIRLDCNLTSGEYGQNEATDIPTIKCMGKANPSNETCISDIDENRKCCYVEFGTEKQKSCNVFNKALYDGKTGPFTSGQENINCYIPPNSTTPSKKSGAAFLKSVIALISLIIFL